MGMSENWKGGGKFLNTWKKRYMPSLEEIFWVDRARKSKSDKRFSRQRRTFIKFLPFHE